MTFILLIWLLGVSLAAALLIIGVRASTWERTATEAAAGLLLASFPFIFPAFSSLPLLIMALVIHAWFFILPARLLKGRLEHEFLRHSTQQNVLLGLALVIVAGVLQLWQPESLAVSVLASWLATSCALGIFALGQLWWNARRYYIKGALTELPALKDLPTVSVCIPARNEDHALTECLTTVLASNYPKLEVLVLDDCSQDQTSAIIRSFAHDGVRFIQGDTPAAGWLGKNQALDTLAQHASGEYLFFMDVDTHVTPQSITAVIQHTLQNNLNMVSILPQNRLGAGIATLCNTLDYYWRQVLPISRAHMPVSSKAWLIQAARLKSLGGFASASRKIAPEESFAFRLALKHSYRFIVSNRTIGVTTAKRWDSQIESAIRMYYPRLQRQPMFVLTASMVLLGLFLAPFAALFACALLGIFNAIWWLSVTASGLLILTYAVVLMRSQPKTWLLAMFLLPVVVVQEVAVLAASMLQYEFGEVNWKGRNVCYPVLAVGQPRFSPQVWRQRQL